MQTTLTGKMRLRARTPRPVEVDEHPEVDATDDGTARGDKVHATQHQPANREELTQEMTSATNRKG